MLPVDYWQSLTYLFLVVVRGEFLLWTWQRTYGSFGSSEAFIPIMEALIDSDARCLFPGNCCQATVS
ncbi:unnamed protein product [Boreogadus saida]